MVCQPWSWCLQVVETPQMVLVWKEKTWRSDVAVVGGRLEVFLHGMQVADGLVAWCCMEGKKGVVMGDWCLVDC